MKYFIHHRNTFSCLFVTLLLTVAFTAVDAHAISADLENLSPRKSAGHILVLASHIFYPGLRSCAVYSWFVFIESETHWYSLAGYNIYHCTYTHFGFGNDRNYSSHWWNHWTAHRDFNCFRRNRKCIIERTQVVENRYRLLFWITAWLWFRRRFARNWITIKWFCFRAPVI